MNIFFGMSNGVRIGEAQKSKIGMTREVNQVPLVLRKSKSTPKSSNNPQTECLGDSDVPQHGYDRDQNYG